MPNGAAAPVEAMPMTVRTMLWSCVPSRSDKALLDIVCHSFTASLDCPAEPTSENIDALASTVEVIEQLFPNSWESLLRPEAPPTRAAPLRRSVELSAQFAELNQLGIAVFDCRTSMRSLARWSFVRVPPTSRSN